MVLCRLSLVDIFSITLVCIFLELLCDGAVEVIMTNNCYIVIIVIMRNLYGDSQGAGRSGDRISVVAKFFTGTGAQLASRTMGTGSPSRG